MRMRFVSVAFAGLFAATAANATILTVFDSIPAGSAAFDTTVAAAGGTSSTDIWTKNVSFTADRGDYLVSRTSGGSFGTTTYGSMTGRVMDISPNGSFGAPNGTISAGITFTFDNPVNAIGFEVGDWATCCHNPTTSLFISFDDGAPIMVASATNSSNGRFPNAAGSSVYEIFVAAFDDTGDFTKVQFWGDGSGEVLYAGGQVKYALLEQNSLPGGNVPEPASMALLGLGLAGLAVARRRKVVAN